MRSTSEKLCSQLLKMKDTLDQFSMPETPKWRKWSLRLDNDFHDAMLTLNYVALPHLPEGRYKLHGPLRSFLCSLLLKSCAVNF